MSKFHFYSNNLKIFIIICLLFIPVNGAADDTCMFTVNAGDVPPSIILLLDNGAEMEQIYWHSSYDNNVDYTPAVSVFSNAGGYSVGKSGNKYYLYPIQNDLSIGSCGIIAAPSFNVPAWTINFKTITLPAAPSTSVDGNNIKDNASCFRYSTNYLNWLFYSGLYTGDGSDLPVKSRFYYAKEAIMQVAKLTSNKVKFGIYNFANTSGGSQVQPLGLVVSSLAADPADNTLDPNFINNINNMGTVTYSPLAEGLASVGGYYGSPSSGVVDNYCQKLFSIIITPGVSSEDQAAAAQSSPASLSDSDGDSEGISLTISGSSYEIPVNQNGSTYLDDVAYYHYTNDIVDYSPGFQRVNTYTLGFMGNNASNKFLINTSNNGNGNFNLYDETDPEYGKYHFEADDPDTLPEKLLEAINLILSETATFTAPVVPVTRTTSGDRIYMAFFKPGNGNFWSGRVEKFGIVQDSDGNSKIVDSNGLPATWPNGAMRETAEPYWSTGNWAIPGETNYIYNQSRNIYTNLGVSSDLTDFSNEFNTGNTSITDALLGNPAGVTVNETAVTGRQKVIDFVLGADVLDEDNDGNTTENRKIITGDILHSEPAVVAYQNAYSSNIIIYYGANDGMLHAVNDSNGAELWGFIPDDQLNRLKDMIEGSGHQYYVDSSPKIFITGNGDNVVNNGEQAILICGQRRGGESYFALDITNPNSPLFLWTFSNADLGQSWSEPVFGKFKTAPVDPAGTNAIVIGGGYSAANATGKAVFIIDIITGAILKKFDSITDMDYSIPSTVKLIDENTNGFIDKIYVGDLGGQMWRIGRFIAADDTTPLSFPNSNEDISTWSGYRLFAAASAKKIFYPPAVTLERGFDMVFWGTGDRTDACNPVSSDKIYVVKDQHLLTTLIDSDLEDVTDPAAPLPDMTTDQGFYLNLANGEKVLAEGIVFYKTYYVTTFIPNITDPCVPGGTGTMYALDYLTGKAKIDFDEDGTLDRTVSLGGGIPSKPVMIIPPHGSPKILITIGTTNPDINSEETNAGILVLSPIVPSRNYFHLWWRIIR